MTSETELGDLARRLRIFDLYRCGLDRLVTGGRVVPAWTSGGSVLGFVDGPPDARIAWRVDVSTGERTPLVDVEKARGAIAEATGQTPPGQYHTYDRVHDAYYWRKVAEFFARHLSG